MIRTRSIERVLVTGAGGFIGSHVVEQLVARGASVRAFVRYNSRNDFGRLELLPAETLDQVEVFTGDLTNPEAVRGAVEGCDTVIHLGALIPIPYSYRHPREFVAANVEGTLNVLEAVRALGADRIVQASTSEVYGTAQMVPIPEAHPLHPQSPYAASKVASDQLALSYERSFGLPVVVARPFNTFGARQSARAVIPTIISQALTRDRVDLGALETTRDFLYVTDTARGFIACAETEDVVGREINLGSGREHSIGDVATMVGRILGRDLDVVSVTERLRPADSEVERLLADTQRAAELLDWTPEVSFEQGLRTTIDWVGTALETFKPELYNL
jgi:NAD dependent epimerase/dehydratase